MRRLISVLVVVLVAVFAVSTFGAGIGVFSQDSFGFGIKGLGSINTGSGFSNSIGGYSNAYFGLSYDPKKANVQWDNWQFSVDSTDPSKWNAICYMSGLYLPEADPTKNEYGNWSVAKGLISVSEYSSITTMTTWDSGEPVQFLQLNGGLNVSPATISSSYFNMYDSDTWMWDPTVGKSMLYPGWQAQYRASGQFLANTLTEAQAMGTAFMQSSSSPEPSTFLLLATGAMGLGIVIWRKKR